MKDLGARRQLPLIFFAPVTLLALLTLSGCQGLDAQGSNATNGRLLVTNPTLTFGTVVLGTNQVLTNTIVNTSFARITLTRASLSQSDFTLSGPELPMTLNPGQGVSFSVTYAPHAQGSSTGTVFLASSATAFSTSFIVSGTAVKPGTLTVSPAPISLGNVRVGATQNQQATFSNTGGTNLTITQATVNGNSFTLSGLKLPVTLAPNQSVNANVSFTPTAGGAQSGSISVQASVAMAVNQFFPGPRRFTPVSLFNTTVSVPLSASGTTAGQLAVNPASITMGNVPVGSSQVQAGTLTNMGGSNVMVSQAAATGSGFSVSGINAPMTLAPGQSTNFSVRFTPPSSGSSSGNVMFMSDAANSSLAVPVAGSGVTPGTLSASQATLSFGSVLVGNNQSMQETLTNSGGSSVTISQTTATGNGFGVSGLSLPLTLAAGQSATFNVTFAPQASGALTGYLAITSNASNSLGVSLSGTGITAGSLAASSPTLSFGGVPVGNNQSVQETLTNSGGSSVTISQATVTGNGFGVSGLSLPLTLGAGQGVNFNVAFAPQAGGSAAGTISIASNASNSTLLLSLSGSGVTPGSLTASAPSLSFGNVQVGGNQSLPETLTNSGGSSVTISQATISGSSFAISGLSLPVALAPGQSVSFNVAFAPQAATSTTGSISIASSASNPTLAVALSGSGVTQGSLTANSSSLSFGNVQVGGNQSLPETLTNAGGSSVTISQATVTGNGFSVSGLSLPLTLAAGQSTSFNVAFAPQAGSAVTGYLAITSNASNSLGISLAGTGVALGALTASSPSLSFGNVLVSNTQSVQETVTNSGGSSVTISQATVTGPGFGLSGLNLPLTLAAGQSTSFSVTFAPQSGGSSTGGISIASNASNPTLPVALSGNGVTPGSLTASVSSLSFGNVQVSNSQSLQETLTNSGGSSVTISQATVTGTGFGVSGLSLPLTLAAGQATSFSVTFAPQSGGSSTGGISIASNASNPTLPVTLSGNGVTPGSLTASASSLSFGNVQVSNSQSLQETLTNSGGSSVTISQATVTGTGFGVSGLSLPLTLAAGQSTSFNVAFAPQASGAVTGYVAITSNASNSLGVSLAGTGVTAGTLTASSSSLSFGNVLVSNTQSVQETVTNSGGSSATISQVSVSGSGFAVSGLSLPMTLAAGQSTSFNVNFAPQAAGSASGSLSIVSNASNATLAISLSGTGSTPGVLAVTSSSLSFGNVQVSATQSLPETVTNSGGTSLTISQANVSGTGFAVTGLSLPLTLAPGQSFTFGTTFTPTSSGNAGGTLSLVSNASNPTLTVSLAGTGAVSGQLTVSPASLNFGSVVTGQSSSLPASISASGASVRVSSAMFGTSEFTLSGVTFPLTLAAGQSASFQVVFTPQASGTASDTASFLSNAANSPAVESLGGTGTTPPQHSVSLSWNGGGADVTGYNIYRSTASGSQGAKMNSTLDASPDYSDSSVQAGQTYYYVTTAVNGSGMESAASNQVKVVIPTP